MATAAEQTSIIELIVGMVGAAPGADILAELVDIVDAGVTMEELAVALQENPAYSGDTGLFPNYLPNAIYAEQFVTSLLGGETTAVVLTEAIDAFTAALNAGDSRGAVSYSTVVALAASTDPDYADASAALANKTEVAEYYSVTLALSSLDLDELIGVVANVDSSAGAVAAAKAAIDAANEVPFDLATGVAAIDAANDAIAAFLTAEATTESAIALAVTNAITAYDTALNNVVAASSNYATDTAATKAAVLAAASGIAAADLADAEAALALVSGGVNAVPGLSAAIAAADAAADAVTAAVATAAATQVAADAASASWVVNSNAGAKVDSSTNTAGVLTVTVDDGTNTPFTDNTVLTLTKVSGTTGQVSLAAPLAGWNAAQLTAFTALQEGTGVAEVIATFNADETADDNVAALTTAAAKAQYSADFLDLDAASKLELKAIGEGFTLTTPPVDPTKTTETQIAAEKAAHAATVIATAAIAVGTGAALVAANAADATADANLVTFNGLVATYDAAVLANAANTDVVDSYAALAAYDAAGYPTIGGGSQAEIIAADAATQVTIAAEIVELGNIITSTAAAQTLAGTTDAAAIATAAAAVTADAAFKVLTDALDAGITVNPLQALVAPQVQAVKDAQVFVDDIADAVADLADAQTAATALASLIDARDDAVDAFGDNGFSTPNDVDATAEFGTALDDIFIAGTLNSDIYNFNLQGDDILYVGTDAVLNTTEIGAGTGQTALALAGDVLTLELFLVESGSDVDVVIETKPYGSETGNYTTITLIGVDIADVSIADGFLTVV